MLKSPHLWHHLESQAQVASVFGFFASPAWLNERLNDIEASDSPILVLGSTPVNIDTLWL